MRAGALPVWHEFNVVPSNVWDSLFSSAQLVVNAAASVWDEPTASHVTAGTFGQTLYTIRANTAQAGAAGTITLMQAQARQTTSTTTTWS